MRNKNSKAKEHITVTVSRESAAWLRAEAASQQTSRSQILDSLAKNYRHDVYLLEKIREVIREELARQA